MDPKEYTGKEWTDLLREMSPREVRKVLKKAYRRTAKKAVGIAQESLRTSGLGGDMKSLGRCIRPHIYSKGGGFLVTVNARRGKANGSGEKGMYKTARGAKKPILMWAEDGTGERESGGNVSYVYTGNTKWGSRHGSAYKLRRKRVRSGGIKRGKMPAYHFLRDAEPRMLEQTEKDLIPELEKAVMDAARKAGFV